MSAQQGQPSAAAAPPSKPKGPPAGVTVNPPPPPKPKGPPAGVTVQPPPPPKPKGPPAGVSVPSMPPPPPPRGTAGRGSANPKGNVPSSRPPVIEDVWNNIN
eukprot:1382267-Amphidinium_carterae.1